MFDWVYKKRLKDDLEGWVSKGWVRSESAVAILNELDEVDGRTRLPMALAGIGMVCVALALFAFIAANWDAIPKAVKLVGIAVMIAGSHGLAGYAAVRGKKGIADLLTGFATLAFVGGMALIGQIFHLPSDWAGGAFLVCLGGLSAAWLTGSRTSLFVGAVAAIVWQVSIVGAGDIGLGAAAISLLLLTAVTGHAIIYVHRVSRWAAVCLLWVIYCSWIVDIAGFMAKTFGYSDDLLIPMIFVGGGGLAAVLVQLDAIADLYVKWSSERPRRSHGHWLMSRSLQDSGMLVLNVLLVTSLIMQSEWRDGPSNKGLLELEVLVPYGLAAVLAMIGLLLSFKTPKAVALFAAVGLALLALQVSVLTDNVLVLATFCLASLIGFCALGTWYNNRLWMLWSYLGLTAVALWLLQVTIGSLLGQSLFFLVAGVLLLCVALWLARLFQKSGNKSQEAAANGEAGA